MNKLYTTINEFKRYINENNISPNRFRDSDLNDIIDFVDQLLYNSKNKQ